MTPGHIINLAASVSPCRIRPTRKHSSLYHLLAQNSEAENTLHNADKQFLERSGLRDAPCPAPDSKIFDGSLYMRFSGSSVVHPLDDRQFCVNWEARLRESIVVSRHPAEISQSSKTPQFYGVSRRTPDYEIQKFHYGVQRNTDQCP